MKLSLRDRLLSKAEVDHATGCWVWTAAHNREGYGRIHIDRGHIGYAHRVAYELFAGPIPSGMDLDHLCRRPACINPSHLEPVSRRTNLLRGQTLTRAHRDGVDCGFDGCRTCRRFQVAS